MNADVLIVGAGPTGLMLACWLTRLGIRPLVIDKKSGLTRESRALAVQARTLETYDMLGLVADALPQGRAVVGVNLQVNQHRVGHIKLGEIGRGLSAYPYLFILGQDKNEHLLLAHYQEQGGEVRWETSLGELRPDDDGVSVELCSALGEKETVRVQYVCGCDGAASTVRQALDIDFSGGTYTERYFVTDVRASSQRIQGELSLWLGDKSFFAFFPMPGQDHYRIVGTVPPHLEDQHDLTFAQIQPRVEQYSDMRVSETYWFSTYNVHHRVANTFRSGRVFLLGDAGHIHSPTGGQGMNTGLMDATNLGWKLAAVLQGKVDTRLLASYELERMPFARLLVKTTDRAFSLATATTQLTRLFRKVFIPLMIPALTHLPPVRRALFGLISQTRVSYRTSPLSQGVAGSVRAGDRLPWVEWPEGGSNYDALRTLKPQFQVYGTVSSQVEAFVRQHPEFSLTRLPWTSAVARAGFKRGALYFLRPDGYVAYAATDFRQEAFLTFLRDAWGWQDEAASLPGNLSTPTLEVSRE